VEGLLGGHCWLGGACFVALASPLRGLTMLSF
jgi:hypothetical protein